MEELNKTNRLTMIVSAILLVIIIGLISFQRPDVKYVLSPSESLTLLSDPALVVTPDQFALMQKDSSGKTVLIDVRNSIAYERGHISNAINIPVRELFSRKNKAFFKEIEKSGQSAILYGETQQQANGPWLMLLQTGFKNVKLFTGNYAQLNPAKADSLTKILPQLSETPLIDISALKLISAPADKNSEASKADKAVKKTVSPVKKTSSLGGGC